MIEQKSTVDYHDISGQLQSLKLHVNKVEEENKQLKDRIERLENTVKSMRNVGGFETLSYNVKNEYPFDPRT